MPEYAKNGRISTTKQVIRRAGIWLFVVVAALIAGLGFSQYRATVLRVETEAHRGAHVVATQFYWMFQTSAQALRRIEDTIGDPAQRQPGDVANIYNAVRDLPPAFHYSVYAANGDLQYSSLVHPPQVNVADRAYFIAARDGAELGIAPEVTDRQSGARVFILARRLNRNGTFLGVATIAVPQDTLRELAAAIGEPDRVAVALVRSDGMMLSRHPPAAPRKLFGSPLLARLRDAPDGTFSTLSAVDGRDRIVGYWTLDGWDVVATVAVERAPAFRGVVRMWLATSLILLPFLLLLAILFRRVNLLMRYEQMHLEQLEQSNDRSLFQLREIHHRVKNNLQMVMSLIRLEDVPRAMKESLLSRITTIVKVHEEMYEADRFEQINLGPYLERLVRRIAATSGSGVRPELSIEPVDLAGDRAMLVGLLLNELVMNAYKHALGPGRGDRLKVSLQQSAPGWLRLVVADNGPGLASDIGPGLGSARPGSGIGRRLISAFAGQLDATISIESRGGVTVTVDLPMAAAPVPKEGSGP